MNIYGLVLVVGLALVVFGAVLLLRYPDRQGGSVKAFTVEVTAPGAGVVVIVLGLAVTVLSAAQLANTLVNSQPQPPPTVAVAATPTGVVVAATALVPTPTVAAATSTVVTATLTAGGAWSCTIQGNFNLRNSAGSTFAPNGAALKKGDHVQILGWSRPIDGSSDIPWFKVVTADGRTGWIINSAPGPNNSRIDYPTCNFGPAGPTFPFSSLTPP